MFKRTLKVSFAYISVAFVPHNRLTAAFALVRSWVLIIITIQQGSFSLYMQIFFFKVLNINVKIIEKG